MNRWSPKPMLLALAAAALPNAANAEVLTVEGLSPAGSAGFNNVQTLAIDRFGGSDGEELAFLLEDRLQNITIFDQPYFDVVDAQSAVEPEAILRGTATAGINQYETREYRRRCVERDEDGKCSKHQSIKVSCLKRVIDFRAQVRASGFGDGRRIYSESFPNKHEQTICFGDDQEFSSSENEVRKMVASTANAVRRDLAPRQYRSKIRVLESRKGMAKADRKFFKAAVKMTKTNEAEACRMWDEAAANGLQHISLTFNRGLCAEMRDDREDANILYQEALALSPKKLEVRQSMERVTDHQRAQEEWELRQSVTSPEADSEQG